MPSAPLRHVVAMGGSAGSFAILLEQVRRLRAGDHACLFVVYHRAGDRPFSFQHFLGPRGFRTAPARDGLAVEPNTLYHPHLSQDLEVREGTLRVLPPEGRHHPSIDRLFTSLAENYGRLVIAVLLSGYATDGVEGLRQVRAHGGRTLVQDPDDAEVPDLPRHAVDAGLADGVLPASGILEALRTHLGESLVQEGQQRAPGSR